MEKKELEKIANKLLGTSAEDRLYGTSDGHLFSAKHMALNYANERNNPSKENLEVWEFVKKEKVKKEES